MNTSALIHHDKSFGALAIWALYECRGMAWFFPPKSERLGLGFFAFLFWTCFLPRFHEHDIRVCAGTQNLP
jgi:hypothetical protein